MLTIMALDANRTRRGFLDPISAKAVLRDSDTGTWVIEIDAAHHLADDIDLDWSVIIDDGVTRISGPITHISNQLDTTENTLTISGLDELYRLADRLIYPNPQKPAGSQDTARFTSKGPAEAVIKGLVLANAGDRALPERRSPQLVVEPIRNLGRQVSISERFSNLLEVCTGLARGASLTFSAVRTEQNTVVFSCRAGRDLSRQVRFIAETGSAPSGSYSLDAATVTTAIMAGQGEGAERYINEVSRPGVRRIERLRDRRDTDDKDAIAETAEELLDEGAMSAAFDLDVEETAWRIFGEHYGLGDTITVQRGALTVSEPVRVAEITWDGHGRTVKITVGDTTNESTPSWVEHIKKLDARMRGLERI